MRLKEYRSKAGLTQKMLADKSGVNIKTIQQYEQGQRNLDGAGLDILMGLAESLKIPFFNLIENEDLRDRLKNTITFYSKQ